MLRASQQDIANPVEAVVVRRASHMYHIWLMQLLSHLACCIDTAPSEVYTMTSASDNINKKTGWQTCLLIEAQKGLPKAHLHRTNLSCPLENNALPENLLDHWTQWDCP